MRRMKVVLVFLGSAFALGACSGDGPMRFGRSSGPGDSVLELFGPPDPAEIIAWAADPYDAGKRQRGILLLASMPYGGEPVYVELYERALKDGDAAVRSASARALSMHGETRHAEELAEHLQDVSVLVRREAARSLQRLHNEEVVGALIAALDSRAESDADVRERVASALGQYASADVVQALIGALNDRMLRVNMASEASLQTLTGQDLGPERPPWVHWVNSTPDLFTEQIEYIFPVFRRDPTLAEKLLPWRSAPNESPGSPVGMSPVEQG